MRLNICSDWLMLVLSAILVVVLSGGIATALGTRAENSSFLPLVLQGAISPTLTSTPTTTPTSPTCVDLIVNGGFETNTAWVFPATAYQGGYTDALAHTGSRAMRTGLPEGHANVRSYSSGYQAVTIPADVKSAVLMLWTYTRSGAVVEHVSLDNLWTEPLASDAQYGLILDSNGHRLRTLFSELSNDQTWQWRSFDLSAYRDRTIRIHFETYNDGKDSTAALYVDDVSLLACYATPATGTPTATPSPTPTTTHTATPTGTPFGTATATPTLTATPTVTPFTTATATPTSTVFPSFVREMVIAPGEPGTIYALTNGDRLLTSGDRGASWHEFLLGLPPAAYPAGLGIDYAHPQTLYIGTAAGLFRTNAERTGWEFVHSIRTGALSVQYGVPNVLWATLRSAPQDFGDYVMVVKSDDRGVTWRAASLGLSGWGAGNPIIIDPDDPNTLFVITFSKYGAGFLYRGTQAGTWQRVPIPEDSFWRASRGLAFDNGANALYLGTLMTGKLYRSLNANALNLDEVTWEQVYDFGAGRTASPLAIGWGPNGAALYVNVSDMSDWLPHLMRSDDGGQTWVELTLPPGPPPRPQNQYQIVANGYPVQRLLGDRRIDDMYGFTAIGLHRYRPGADWSLVTSAPLRPDFVISPADPDILWSGVGRACLADGPDEQMYKSSDGGRTWVELPGGLNLKPFVAHPSDPYRIYAAGCDGPYLSVDGGATWQHQPSSLWQVYNISDIAPVDPDWTVVYAAGVSEGGVGIVARSTDGGASWSQVTPADPGIWWITDVWVDPTNSSRVYFIEPNGVWRSTDAGNTWVRFITGLDDVLYQPGSESYGLRQIVSRVDDASRLYLGTVRGLYEGFHFGETWSKISGYTWDEQPVDGLVVRDTASGGLFLNSLDGAYYLYRSYATPTPTPTPGS